MIIRQFHAARVVPRTNREAEPVRIHVVGEIGQLGWTRPLARAKGCAAREMPSIRAVGIVGRSRLPAITLVSGTRGLALARGHVRPGKATTRGAGIAARGRSAAQARVSGVQVVATAREAAHQGLRIWKVAGIVGLGL